MLENRLIERESIALRTPEGVTSQQS